MKFIWFDGTKRKSKIESIHLTAFVGYFGPLAIIRLTKNKKKKNIQANLTIQNPNRKRFKQPLMNGKT